MSLAETASATPSSAYIALALVTIRSKPAEISLQDYLTMLSNSVIKNPDGNTSFEAALFWKQAFDKVQKEKAVLQEYVHRTESSRVDGTGDGSPTKKRKADKRPFKANTQSKRRNIDRSTSPEIGTTDLDSDSTGAILRHAFQLNCLLRNKTPPLDQLCLRIGSICQASEAILVATKTGHSPANLQAVSTLFTTNYPSMLKALEHAMAGEASDEHLTIANASIVQLFQRLLGHLHRLALDEVTRREEVALAKKLKGNTARKPDIKSILIKDSRTITQLLISILNVNFAKDSHCELFEGLLCALMDHIGSILSFMVFADPDTNDVGIEPPVGLTDVTHIKRKAALTAAEVEGSYLVVALRAGLRLLRKNHYQMSDNMREVFAWTDMKDMADGNALWEKIERRLQGTLLRACFGNEDPAFENALRREHPLEQADIEAIEKLQDIKDGPTWFISQMWEELGWDILSKQPNID